jgi:hypothetical protein
MYKTRAMVYFASISALREFTAILMIPDYRIRRIESR